MLVSARVRWDFDVNPGKFAGALRPLTYFGFGRGCYLKTFYSIITRNLCSVLQKVQGWILKPKKVEKFRQSKFQNKWPCKSETFRFVTIMCWKQEIHKMRSGMGLLRR